MILFRVLLVLFLVLVTYSSVLAGNFGVGAHIGYGVFKHKEIDKGQEARSTQDVILFGVSGEYSFVKPDKFFVGITTDWTIGLEDKEEWTVNDTQVLTNDIKITGQFYD
ncbi:MAG TPA: hypothetical protein ENH31_08060, partial [Nitrospirae bacterium]|nr:hypothetical protein [Nitrospirota bacterium]